MTLELTIPTMVKLRVPALGGATTDGHRSTTSTTTARQGAEALSSFDLNSATGG